MYDKRIRSQQTRVLLKTRFSIARRSTRVRGVIAATLRTIVSLLRRYLRRGPVYCSIGGVPCV
jgi:hypothetical protein